MIPHPVEQMRVDWAEQRIRNAWYHHRHVRAVWRLVEAIALGLVTWYVVLTLSEGL